MTDNKLFEETKKRLQHIFEFTVPYSGTVDEADDQNTEDPNQEMNDMGNGEQMPDNGMNMPQGGNNNAMPQDGGNEAIPDDGGQPGGAKREPRPAGGAAPAVGKIRGAPHRGQGQSG